MVIFIHEQVMLDAIIQKKYDAKIEEKITMENNLITKRHCILTTAKSATIIYKIIPRI